MSDPDAFALVKMAEATRLTEPPSFFASLLGHTPDYRAVANCYIEIANTYSAVKRHDKAAEFYILAAQTACGQGMRLGAASLYSKAAYHYELLDSPAYLDVMEKAAELYFEGRSYLLASFRFTDMASYCRGLPNAKKQAEAFTAKATECRTRHEAILWARLDATE